MLQNSLGPVPRLPVELKKEILRFCDQPTLAKSSGFSFEFLQLSSPLLYRQITLRDPISLTKLISIVASPRQPALTPYLNLALIHSLTYIDDPKVPFFPDDDDEDELPSINPLRLLLPFSPSPLLPLHTLHLLISGHCDSRFHFFFDPVEFQLSSLSPTSRSSTLNFSVERWTRLRSLLFEDAFPYTTLLRSGFHEASFGNGPRVRIEYALTDEDEDAEQLRWISGDLDTDGEGYERERSLIENVVVRVRSEEQKVWLLRDLEESLLLPCLTVVVEG